MTSVGHHHTKNYNVNEGHSEECTAKEYSKIIKDFWVYFFGKARYNSNAFFVMINSNARG